MRRLVTQRELGRDLALLVVGALVGAGVASGAFLVFDGDDDDVTAGQNTTDVPPPDPGDTRPAVDPTETEFGELSDESETAGVMIQWVAELSLGGQSESTEFVTAHRPAVFVLQSGDIRVVEQEGSVTLCRGDSCSGSSAAEASSAFDEAVGTFFELLRLVDETTSAPDDRYQITGETQLENGIFQQCGQYDPADFGVEISDVRLITQCVDGNRDVPLSVDLVGADRSLGTAVFSAIADAEASLFETPS